jgi:aspartate aminotransferase
MRLSDRIGRVQPSPTLAISAKASALKAAGVDVVSFSAGEPDFNTPAPICEAAKAAIDAGKTKYTPASGVGELRAAIAADYAARGREVTAAQTLVSVGGKHSLYNASQVLFQPGDKVIVPAPYWVSYPAQILLAGAEPVILDCAAEAGFKLTPDQLSAALADEAVNAIILCSPSNPTGSVYTAEELAALGEVLLAHERVRVLFDAIYDRLYYGGAIAPDLVATVPGLDERTITFNGFSKTYAMTGWRLGYAIGPEAVIAAMGKLQSQSTSNPTSFAQYGAIEALEMGEEAIAGMRETFRGRRDLLVGLLNEVPGVTCSMPEGAFYAFPDFNAHIGERFEDDLALAGFLLEEAKVALVPGSAFGAPGFMRLSYATGEDLITEGVKRIREALS